MRFTEELLSLLEPDEAAALSAAVEMVDDLILGELVDRHNNPFATIDGQFSMLYLPPRYAHLYDFKLLRRLHVCLQVIAARLQDGWEPPRCRGEELVTRAVLEQAVMCLEEMEEAEPTDVFEHLREFMFLDLDHEFMFDLIYDGIDDPQTPEGALLGTGPLDPTAWFKPLYENRPVHPMAQ